MPNLITMTIADGRFPTLIRALTAAGMIDTLSGSGPFTLFAPTDKAFNRLPGDWFEDLMRHDAKATLTSLMTLHVVAGKSMRQDLRDGQLLQTINGQYLSIAIKGDDVRVDGATVIAMTEAANGFVYGIDAVLFPAPVN